MKITTIDLGGLGIAKVVDSRKDVTERARISNNAPHSHYALDREDIHKELEAFKNVCEVIGVPKDWTVVEPFGGSGWHSVIIQALVRPKNHIVNDISIDCVNSIRMTLGDKAEVTQRDGYDIFPGVFGVSGDWIHADFNLWTLKKMSEDVKLRKAWLGLFKSAKSCVTFTDTTQYQWTKEGMTKRAVQAIEHWYCEVGEWTNALTGWNLEHVVDWGPASMYVMCPGEKAFSGMAVVTVDKIVEPMKVETLGVEYRENG